jgi:hypothetical protein
VDETKHEIRMYVHGPARDRKEQYTCVAVSKDGLAFEASDALLGKFYFRVFRWKDCNYAIAKNWNSGWGELYRSKDGLAPFESRGNFVPMMRQLQRPAARATSFSSSTPARATRRSASSCRRSRLTDDWKRLEGVGAARRPCARNRLRRHRLPEQAVQLRPADQGAAAPRPLCV